MSGNARLLAALAFAIIVAAYYSTQPHLFSAQELAQLLQSHPPTSHVPY